MTLYKAEDFESVVVFGCDSAGHVADRANALHDERCPGAPTFRPDRRDIEIERLRAAYSDATDQQERLNAMLTDARADNARLREALVGAERELTHLLNVEPSKRFGRYETARDAARAALEGSK